MTFEDELKEHGRFIFTSKGISMWPLIRPGRDVIEISERTEPLKPFDAVVYKDGQGRYVLHRVIRIDGDTYDILGDNNWRMERSVKDGQIIGVLTAVLRDGSRRVDFSSVKYKLYLLLWCRLYPIRTCLLWLRWLAGALLRHLRKAN
ncbi:MAG: S24/S26 family peptidase [Clostridia bacterium]|nr:S24/S26 family peptidase [Clostridia bacterium]